MSGDRHGSVLGAVDGRGARAVRRQGRLDQPCTDIHEQRPPPEGTSRDGESSRIRRKAAHSLEESIEIFNFVQYFAGTLFQNYPNFLFMNHACLT